jgi:alpha-beta hydrolase superfamily lysophospholipase
MLASLVSSSGAGAASSTTTSLSTASSFKWVDQDVSFVVGGLRVYASFRHPVGDDRPVPAVLLIAGSGPTDRNGNSQVEPGPINTLKTLADWLSEDGVASLRYDKLGSGKTGLGPYATKVDSVGIKPFEQESLAALKFLAAQKGVNESQLGVFGHSEGALFALLLATGHAGKAPPIHALGLFEPLSLRYLTLITVQVDAQIAAQLKAGEITKALAAAVDQTLHKAVKHLRATGQVTANLPYGLANVLNVATEKFLYEADKFDPQKLAETLLPTTPVILSCSNADVQVSCSQVQRIAHGLAQAGAVATLVQLQGVDHVLKVDPTGSGANYTMNLPFSPVLRSALETFVKNNL